MSLGSLTYERQPPVGNALIDDDPASVFIRIYPDRTLGRPLAWVFGFFGVAVLLYSVAQVVLSRMSIWQTVPIFFGATLFFLLALIMCYTPRGQVTTMHATAAGIEYATKGFAPRMIESVKISRVFTRDAPLSKRMFLGLRYNDSSEMVLGCGEAKEIEAMARALHRVLNGARAARGACDANG